MLYHLWFAATIAAALLRGTVSQPGRINQVNAKLILDILLDGGAGADFFQSYITESTNMTTQIVDGRRLHYDYVTGLFRRVTDRATAIFSIIEYIKESLMEFRADYNYTDCCNVDLPPEYYDDMYQREADRQSMCRIIAKGSGEAHIFPPPMLLNRFVVNYEAIRGVRQQYFGTEDGALLRYPSMKLCESFDHRTQGWYRNAANVRGKAIVILFDSSERSAYEMLGNNSIHTAAKEVVRTLLRSLDSRDSVYLMPLTDDSTSIDAEQELFDPCFLENFAIASDKVKADINAYLDRLQPHGSSYPANHTLAAFQALADYLESPLRPRDPVVMYVSGVPSDEDPMEVLEVVQDLSQSYSDPALFLYQVGADTEVTEVLRRMDLVYLGNGEFEQLYNLSHLYKIPRIYQHFESNTKEEVIFLFPRETEEVRDAIMTVSAPVYLNEQLIGVAAIDFAVYDFFAEFLNFANFRGDDYAFVLDVNEFMTLYHPLVPPPSEVLGKVPVLPANLLESEFPANFYTNYLRMGRAILALWPCKYAISRGDPIFNGVDDRRSDSAMICVPFSVHSLSVHVCMKFAGISKYKNLLEMTVPKRLINKRFEKNDKKFFYHRFDLTTNDTGTFCRSFYRKTMIDTTAVKFAPRSFKSPSDYMFQEETLEAVNRYTDIIFGNLGNDVFADNVIDEVLLTGILERNWLEGELKFSSVHHMVWRYIATIRGVFRVQPAAIIPKAYDPERRSWYLKAKREAGVRILTPPYLDAFGAGYINTVAVAIKENGFGLVFGVIGIDVTLHYLQFMVDTLFFLECRLSGSCFLIDDSGYIISHPSWVYTNSTSNITVENVHIIDLEPYVGYHLINDGIMTRHVCTDLYVKADRTYYRIETDQHEISHIDNATGLLAFKMLHAPGTNMYVVQKPQDIEFVLYDELNETCECQNVHNYCDLAMEECECPCAAKPNYDVCATDLDSTFGQQFLPCTPPFADPFESSDAVPPSSDYFNYDDVDFCMAWDCSKQGHLGECHSVAHCRWCTHDSQGNTLKTPFCANFDVCWFGQINRIGLYREAEKEQTQNPIVMIITVVAGLAGVAACVATVTAAIQRRQSRKAMERAELMDEVEEEEALFIAASRGRRDAAITIRRHSADVMSENEEKEMEDMQRRYAATRAKRAASIIGRSIHALSDTVLERFRRNTGVDEIPEEEEEPTATDGRRGTLLPGILKGEHRRGTLLPDVMTDEGRRATLMPGLGQEQRRGTAIVDYEKDLLRRGSRPQIALLGFRGDTSQRKASRLSIAPAVAKQRRGSAITEEDFDDGAFRTYNFDAMLAAKIRKKSALGPRRSTVGVRRMSRVPDGPSGRDGEDEHVALKPEDDSVLQIVVSESTDHDQEKLVEEKGVEVNDEKAEVAAANREENVEGAGNENFADV